MLSKATRAAKLLLTVNPAILRRRFALIRGARRHVPSHSFRFASTHSQCECPHNLVTKLANDSYPPGRVRTLSETGRLEPVVERFETLFLAETSSIPGELHLRPVLADFLS